MKLPWTSLSALLLNIISATATPHNPPLVRRQASNATVPVVDLGYGRYKGYYNPEFDLDVYKGIRYAAAPVGKLRWQAPQTPPLSENNSIIPAIAQPPICPQSGAAKTPAIYGFNSGPGDEDCLFLNLYAPPNAKNLPVILWIHGGGFNVFGAVYDPSQLMNTNGNGFISVIIQYRLGAFGFLSSEDIKKNGQLNAGLLDQNFALQWVQKNIAKFGGDPTKVTLAGESAGASSVLLQSMAYGGKQNVTLFTNLLAASVYLGKQRNYNDQVPEQYYQEFVKAAGCSNGANTANLTGQNDSQSSGTAIFDCLVGADTTILQNASASISESGDFGTFAFLPVTDGTFIQSTPSQQTFSGALSGKRLLLGNNADEGAPLTPPTIKTGDDFLDYVNTTFPSLTAADNTRLLQIYQFSNSGTDLSAPLFGTLGDSGPTALNQSEFATGDKQRAFNLFSEAAFTCPGYWFTEAFDKLGKESWKYQYSVTSAYHGADLGAYFSVNPPVMPPTPDMIYTFQKIWGNFIINNTPHISATDAAANATNATIPINEKGNLKWPTYSAPSYYQMDLNTTGGTVQTIPVTPDYSYEVRLGPGVTNDFRLVNANTWEGGRGARCQFWRDVAPRVPQ